MDPKDKKRLQKNRTAITDDFEVKVVKHHLIQKGVLDAEDFQEIEYKPQKKEQAGLLIVVLKGPDAYQCFGEALQERYDWLVRALDDTDVSSVGAENNFDTLACGLESLQLEEPEKKHQDVKVNGFKPTVGKSSVVNICTGRCSNRPGHHHFVHFTPIWSPLHAEHITAYFEKWY